MTILFIISNVSLVTLLTYFNYAQILQNLFNKKLNKNSTKKEIKFSNQHKTSPPSDPINPCFPGLYYLVQTTYPGLYPIEAQEPSH
jgi:hypothetical protein